MRLLRLATSRLRAATQRFAPGLAPYIAYAFELPVLILLVLGGVGMWAFAEIAEWVMAGESHHFDRVVILALRTPGDLSDPIGPQWLEEMLRDVTALGGVTVLLLLTAATAVYLLLVDKRRVALFVIVAVAGGLLISSLFKTAFDRPRPDLVPHATHVYSASFPSGHSMMSAVTYLTLGALLARMHQRRRVKAYFLGLAVFLTLAVGVSRIYLGVHWPTDVLAGWAAGACWAIACWVIALWLQYEHVVEPQLDAR